MKRIYLKVDRVEEGVAVCYAPEGNSMLPVPLPKGLRDTVHDGDTVAVCFNGERIISVELFDRVDASTAEERRLRLKKLFDRK